MHDRKLNNNALYLIDPMELLILWRSLFVFLLSYHPITTPSERIAFSVRK